MNHYQSAIVGASICLGAMIVTGCGSGACWPPRRIALRLCRFEHHDLQVPCVGDHTGAGHQDRLFHRQHHQRRDWIKRGTGGSGGNSSGSGGSSSGTSSSGGSPAASNAPHIDSFSVNAPTLCARKRLVGRTCRELEHEPRHRCRPFHRRPGRTRRFRPLRPVRLHEPHNYWLRQRPGTVITHSYDLWTLGGTGSQDHQSVVLHITVTPASGTGSGSSGSSNPPIIDSFSVSAPSQCVQGNASSVNPVVSWTTSHATGVALSIDNPGRRAPWQLRDLRLDQPDIHRLRQRPGTVITHSYDLWTLGGTGPRTTRAPLSTSPW